MRESSEREGRGSSGGLVQEATEGVREGVARGGAGVRRGSVSGTGEGVPSPVPEDSIAADGGSGNPPNPFFSLLFLFLSRDTQHFEPQIRALLGSAPHFCGVVVLELRTVPIGTALNLRVIRRGTHAMYNPPPGRG